ncbi:hypothetical protein B0H12DRAFT_1236107 [Mycena haematopus]|nr:hypothetical protein B0H12DRAFT_1236107 [Mycena haematopus]
MVYYYAPLPRHTLGATTAHAAVLPTSHNSTDYVISASPMYPLPLGMVPRPSFCHQATSPLPKPPPFRSCISHHPTAHHTMFGAVWLQRLTRSTTSPSSADPCSVYCAPTLPRRRPMPVLPVSPCMPYPNSTRSPRPAISSRHHFIYRAPVHYHGPQRPLPERCPTLLLRHCLRPHASARLQPHPSYPVAHDIMRPSRTPRYQFPPSLHLPRASAPPQPPRPLKPLPGTSGILSTPAHHHNSARPPMPLRNTALPPATPPLLLPIAPARPNSTRPPIPQYNTPGYSVNRPSPDSPSHHTQYYPPCFDYDFISLLSRLCTHNIAAPVIITTKPLNWTELQLYR